jgi:hypothetical protein
MTNHTYMAYTINADGKTGTVQFVSGDPADIVQIVGMARHDVSVNADIYKVGYEFPLSDIGVKAHAATVEAIDITPTWGEFGNIAIRLAETGERKAFAGIKPDCAKAFASAQALKEITSTLTPEQSKIVAAAMVRELGKMGY